MIRFFPIMLSLLLTGCADLSYYLHSVGGHLDVVSRSRDIEDVLQDNSTPQSLRQRLQLVDEIRRFAFEDLGLPQSDSYTEYADLERDYAVRSLFATEEFSVNAHQWCYPVIGCAGYRGYYDELRLKKYIDELKTRRFDTYVASVPAYSTLGWFDDPVLNTFVYWPEYRLAGLIFHELSHQRLYVEGDSTFNESFAIAVQQAGVTRWLQSRGEHQALADYRRHIESRGRVLEFIRQQRAQLAALYQNAGDEDSLRAAKALFFEEMRRGYRALSASFAGSDGFSKWFSGELNNAKLVSISTYHELAPAFLALLDQHGGDLVTFYRHVERIAELEPRQRRDCLETWSNEEKTMAVQLPAGESACRLSAGSDTSLETIRR